MGGRGAKIGSNKVDRIAVKMADGSIRQYQRIGKDGIATWDGYELPKHHKGASFSKALENARKNGTLVKELNKAQTRKIDKKNKKDIDGWRAEVERRKNSWALMGTGTLNRHGKQVKHRALTGKEDYLISFSEWKRQKGR
ncbi:Uncharacterised protein [Streptococcus pneumoniae]|nr:Uncharacterised protein [Streptococcus pneumoniae]